MVADVGRVEMNGIANGIYKAVVLYKRLEGGVGDCWVASNNQ